MAMNMPTVHVPTLIVMIVLVLAILGIYHLAHKH